MNDESTQTDVKLKRNIYQDKAENDGMELWKKQKEFARLKKLKEQEEIRDMLEKYWPWGRAGDAKPRGLRNLRLEELFPNGDYEKAKRCVGTLDLEQGGGEGGGRRGGGGGGAPIINRGKKITRTHEDPFLRFQFGSKDLRRYVDNTLRYKTDKDTQHEYKKQLGRVKIFS
ncbi:hypothetical protein NQ314_015727 [Rhamnusium bicolor]|uniref:Pre-mRNA-splicing factor SYF2 n=1 Tax=Rhamnusium bicolor TaxID=1586634 RepID=A0AAV8WY11_9CUCU|nr:hypothetical protein NQ314_015727 [Rhamnusium bicolor]